MRRSSFFTYSLALFFSITSLFFESFAAEFVPNSFSAKIKQEVKSSLGKGTRVSEGALKYQKKGKVSLIIETPQKDQYTFISNGDKNWYYVPPFNEQTKGEVTVQNNKSSPLALFFDSIDYGPKDNSHYQVKDFVEGFEFTFKGKLSTQLNLKNGKIYFKNDKNKYVKDFQNIELIELTYNDNRIVKLFLSDMKINPVFSSDIFSFSVPANTNIH